MAEAEMTTTDEILSPKTVMLDDLASEAYRVGFSDGEAKARGNFIRRMALNSTEIAKNATSAVSVAIGVCTVYAVAEINFDMTNKAWDAVEPIFSSLGRMF